MECVELVGIRGGIGLCVCWNLVRFQDARECNYLNQSDKILMYQLACSEPFSFVCNHLDIGECVNLGRCLYEG